jgi:hypothetical protein
MAMEPNNVFLRVNEKSDWSIVVPKGIILRNGHVYHRQPQSRNCILQKVFGNFSHGELVSVGSNNPCVVIMSKKIGKGESAHIIIKILSIVVEESRAK